jgi:hypothetical protein
MSGVGKNDDIFAIYARPLSLFCSSHLNRHEPALYTSFRRQPVQFQLSIVMNPIEKERLSQQMAFVVITCANNFSFLKLFSPFISFCWLHAFFYKFHNFLLQFSAPLSLFLIHTHILSLYLSLTHTLPHSLNKRV